MKVKENSKKTPEEKLQDRKDKLKTILNIPKKNDKPVILIGSGKSIDNLDLNLMNIQKRYDTCVISDAIKVLFEPTYAFQYHWKGVSRCSGFLDRPKYLITTYKCIDDFLRLGWKDLAERYFNLKNAYFFNSNHVPWDVIKNGTFDINISEARLQNHEGSVVGCLHFLCGYLGVKDIRYIGFDGGVNPGVTEYGAMTHHGRKGSKIEGAAKDYEKSWKATLKLLEYYPDVKFRPLGEFLKK